MPMTPQAIAAENARRIVGRMVAASDNIGCRDKTVYDLYVAREGRQDMHLMRESSQDIIQQITRQAQVAVARDYNVTFRVTMHIPAFLASADGLDAVL